MGTFEVSRLVRRVDGLTRLIFSLFGLDDGKEAKALFLLWKTVELNICDGTLGVTGFVLVSCSSVRERVSSCLFDGFDWKNPKDTRKTFPNLCFAPSPHLETCAWHVRSRGPLPSRKKAFPRTEAATLPGI